MPLTSNLGRYVYLLWLILMFVCLAATHALFMTAIVRCFGTTHKTTNYGCLILSTTVSGILLSAGSQYLLQDLGYHWAFIITAAFPFTAFLLTAMVTFTPQGYRIA
uniref:MFS domain-containing protein n=1 Tax=Steinernema glaseri TaxID=37863 RepID=A0A1I7Y5J4_9BILA